ncbi:exported protein of unknown function (plasmid) [Azospirillum baldaniorum]|uniref:Glycoside hydrolase family 31 N-terminal domain-containing protein n=1 Tax=Azospirillum baldaniorum TaxID=1064539 RepID=A0A9P1JZ32_9PROT|nr:exported protein of unknown function [Azospirillum baldaniorum]
MRTLTGASLVAPALSRDGAQAGPQGIAFDLDRGYRLTLFPLGPALARVLIERPGGLRTPRTWSLAPELSGETDPALADPIDGRDRRDLTGFPGTPAAVEESADCVTVTTPGWRVVVQRSPLALRWYEPAAEGDGWRLVLADRPTQPYLFDDRSPRFAHHLVSHAGERYHGFGDKSGGTDKRGRRLAMGTTDALGYDAETSDPLYKHIPFCLSVRPERGGAAVGVFYDNLSRGLFDLGQTIDAYHGDFIRFEASDGDLDCYVLFGPSVPQVVANFTALTGRTSFRPRWAISYSGSTMQLHRRAGRRGAAARIPRRAEGARPALRVVPDVVRLHDDRRQALRLPLEPRQVPRAGGGDRQVRRGRRPSRRQHQAGTARRPSEIRRGPGLRRLRARQRRPGPPADHPVLGRRRRLSRLHQPGNHALVDGERHAGAAGTRHRLDLERQQRVRDLGRRGGLRRQRPWRHDGDAAPGADPSDDPRLASGPGGARPGQAPLPDLALRRAGPPALCADLVGRQPDELEDAALEPAHGARLQPVGAVRLRPRRRRLRRSPAGAGAADALDRAGGVVAALHHPFLERRRQRHRALDLSGAAAPGEGRARLAGAAGAAALHAAVAGAPRP